MLDRANFRGNARGRFQLDAVALIIIDRQRNDARARFARKACAHHRVEAARQKDDKGFSGYILHAAPDTPAPIAAQEAACAHGLKEMGREAIAARPSSACKPLGKSTHRYATHPVYGMMVNKSFAQQPPVRRASMDCEKGLPSAMPCVSI